MRSFQVKTTSSALSGWPSLQRTPLGRRNVQVLWSASTLQGSARPGLASCVGASMMQSLPLFLSVTSVEETSLAVMGLNVLGSTKVAMTSRPPRMPGSHLATSGDGGKAPAGGGADGTLEVSDLLPQAERNEARMVATAIRRNDWANFIIYRPDPASIHRRAVRGKATESGTVAGTKWWRGTENRRSSFWRNRGLRPSPSGTTPGRRCRGWL